MLTVQVLVAPRSGFVFESFDTFVYICLGGSDPKLSFFFSNKVCFNAFTFNVKDISVFCVGFQKDEHAGL